MGNNWRFLSERVKQKWGLTAERNFRPTSNARNEAMFSEATRFANQLKQFEKDLRSWQKNVEASFNIMQGTLSAPLPMSDEGDRGHNINPEPLGRAAAELNLRLESMVFKPFQQWMAAYKAIQEHMKKSEELRLILDSRRRTVDTLRGKEERYKSLLTGTNREKGEVNLRTTQHQTIHKEEKMMRDQELFRRKEQTVYDSLFRLIKDTSVLRDYAAAAVQIMEECFAKASEAFMDGVPPATSVVNPYESDQVLMADPNHLNINTSKNYSVQSKLDQHSPGYMPHADAAAYDQKPHSPFAQGQMSPYSQQQQQQYSQAGMSEANHDRYAPSHYAS